MFKVPDTCYRSLTTNTNQQCFKQMLLKHCTKPPIPQEFIVFALLYKHTIYTYTRIYLKKSNKCYRSPPQEHANDDATDIIVKAHVK